MLELCFQIKLYICITYYFIKYYNMENNNKKQLEIEVSPEVAQGIYSNLVAITHYTSEFVVDFVQMMPGVPKASVKSRVILAPEHAKRLLYALQDNISKFESNVAPIQLPEQKAQKGDTYVPNLSDFKGEA